MLNKLPQGWVECELKDVVSILGDGLHGTPKYSENGDYYFINGNNLNDGEILIKDDTKKVDYEEYQKYKKDLNENTVFVSINGTLGNTAFYNNEKIILGKSACYFNLLTIADKKFIRFLLKTDYFNNYANANATGSTIKNVSLKTMREFKIFLPPLNEQKRIVEKIEEEFGKIDEGVEKLKLAQEQIKQYRQSVLKSAFAGKLYKTTEWEEKKLEEILANDQYSMKRGPFGSSLKKAYFVPKGIRVFEQYNPINNDPYWSRYYISDSKYEELKAFTAQAGDLLISCSGTLGKIIELPKDVEKGIINQALLKITLNPEKIINQFFIYLFRSPIMQKKIFDNTIGTAIQNIASVKELKKIKILLPTPDEQKQIVKEIEKRFEVADEVERVITENLEKAEQLKQSILKKAFEGRLVPQNPTDEPASVLLEKIKAERK